VPLGIGGPGQKNLEWQTRERLGKDKDDRFAFEVVAKVSKQQIEEIAGRLVVEGRELPDFRPDAAAQDFAPSPSHASPSRPQRRVAT